MLGTNKAVLATIGSRWQEYTANGRQGPKPTITKQEVEQVRQLNHVIHVYPRKKVACLNGWMYFTIKG
jgi:hypothetical protein